MLGYARFCWGVTDTKSSHWTELNCVCVCVCVHIHTLASRIISLSWKLWVHTTGSNSNSKLQSSFWFSLFTLRAPSRTVRNLAPVTLNMLTYLMSTPEWKRYSMAAATTLYTEAHFTLFRFCHLMLGLPPVQMPFLSCWDRQPLLGSHHRHPLPSLPRLGSDILHGLPLCVDLPSPHLGWHTV